MTDRFEDLFDKAPYEDDSDEAVSEEAAEAQALADWEAGQIGDRIANRIKEDVFIGFKSLKKK